ncbi:MAG: anaerobic ribonucleoside-triphosphate reductase activating protein [Candidatus Fermentibacteraceae bacterium]|nr:anaerobic ribonucleoside-triphosphate reductase activating protein [Candidatus Fermentibacteraceae bacterium]
MIRSLQGTSLIDYPGKISSVLFTAGCNLACPFCHNPELVNVDLLDGEFSMSHDAVIKELNERAGFIDAVVLTGGEPLLYESTIDLLVRIKQETDLAVKLDTNGTFPDRLKRALPLVDFVAMDLKARPENYMLATGGRARFSSVRESAMLLAEQDETDYEFRSTMVPGFINADDVLFLIKELAPARIKRYALQLFRSDNTLSPELRGMPSYPQGYIESLAEKMVGLVDDIQLRI